MLKDYFLLAFRNLRRRKLRSWLTILGIFIGIAAIVAFISLGQGLENYINAQFQEIGTNIIMVMGRAGPVVSPIASSLSSKPLTKDDVELVEKVNGVEIASPMIMYPTSIVYGKEKKDLFLYSLEPKDIDDLFGQLSSFGAEEGRQLKETDKDAAVVGSRFYELFKKKIGLGNRIEINGEKFKIIGILKSIGNPQDDMSVYITNEMMGEITGEKDRVSMIYVKTKEGISPEDVAEKIKEKMREDRDEKKGEESFSVSTAAQMLEMFGQILAVVTIVFIGIASIALVVGGIGIMNTMYTAVLERTREIGIMKAVGATNKDILLIFLMESGLLGLVGGLIGLVLGIGISKAVEYVTINFYALNLLKITFDPVTIISVLLFSFLVGSISGVMPAMQAARLKPVDALRHE